jgi:thymidylate synthase
MVEIKTKTLPEAWVMLLEEIYKHGSMAKTQYGNNAKYLLGVHVIITDYVEQWHKQDPICSKNYLKEYKKELLEQPTDMGFSYTYGNRLHKYPLLAPVGISSQNQIDNIVHALQDGAVDSRRLQAITWIPSVDQFSKEPPCLQVLHFYPEGSTNKLHVTIVYRSHDIYGAMEANIIAIMSMIEDEILKPTGYRLGEIHLYDFNAHIYERDLPAAGKLLG